VTDVFKHLLRAHLILRRVSARFRQVCAHHDSVKKTNTHIIREIRKRIYLPLTLRPDIVMRDLQCWEW
jgi:hypothetical protein